MVVVVAMGGEGRVAVKAGRGVGVGGASRRRAAALLTAKRGEWAVDGADGRREAAWYGRWAEAWKAVDGEGEAEMVGDDVSMATARAGGQGRTAARVEAARSNVGPMPSWWEAGVGG